jgi:hypothetical protein
MDCKTNSYNDNHRMTEQMAQLLRDKIQESGVSLLALSSACRPASTW